MVTASEIKEFCPSAKPALVKAIVDNWSAAKQAGIGTPERIEPEAPLDEEQAPPLSEAESQAALEATRTDCWEGELVTATCWGAGAAPPETAAKLSAAGERRSVRGSATVSEKLRCEVAELASAT